MSTIFFGISTSFFGDQEQERLLEGRRGLYIVFKVLDVKPQDEEEEDQSRVVRALPEKQ